ncbi:MAG: hypothetical protein ABJA57_00005, partial [Ginsengibacter sp.]
MKSFCTFCKRSDSHFILKSVSLILLTLFSFVNLQAQGPIPLGDSTDSRAACNTPFNDLHFGPITFSSNCSCGLTIGYWFAKPGVVWPDVNGTAPGVVTVGGYNYTQEEGLAIWNTSNAGGLPDAKKAFLQATAVKLSSSTILPTDPIWADVAIIDNWLSTLPKLTPTNIYDFTNKDAADAAGRIGVWLSDHDCDTHPIGPVTVDSSITREKGPGCDSLFTKTWTAFQSCSGTTIVTQTITVKYDIEPPVPTGDTTDKIANCNTAFEQLSFGPLSFNDNCDGPISGHVDTNRAPGTGCDSIFTRTWIVTDGCGNTTIRTQAITVKYDHLAPVASGDTTDRRADCNTPSSQLTFGTVTFNDNCDGAIQGTPVTVGTKGDGCDSVFKRTWTATDGCGNTTTVTQSITVKYDSEAPLASGDTTDHTAACNTPFEQLTFGTVTFNDNCDGGIDGHAEISKMKTGCDSVFTKTWSAADGCGNSTTVTQSITVKYDSEAPVASGDTTDKRVACNTPYSQLVFGPVNFNDNCAGIINPEVTDTKVGGATEAGCDSVFTRTWTATDECGNVTIRTQA